jgi:hypothetical protein
MSEILYSKEGFTFSKICKNNYCLNFQINNDGMILSNIIDFNLVKLIYDLNNDIYEKVNLQIINENEAVMILLMKPLFEDLGLPQRFSYVRIKKYINSNKIMFHSQSIYSERPEGIPQNAEQLPIKDMICECDIITSHKILFSFNVLFEEYMIVPQFLEKMIGLILFKILNRVKQFIEKVRM